MLIRREHRRSAAARHWDQVPLRDPWSPRSWDVARRSKSRLRRASNRSSRFHSSAPHGAVAENSLRRYARLAPRARSCDLPSGISRLRLANRRDVPGLSSHWWSGAWVNWKESGSRRARLAKSERAAGPRSPSHRPHHQQTKPTSTSRPVANCRIEPVQMEQAPGPDISEGVQSTRHLSRRPSARAHCGHQIGTALSAHGRRSRSIVGRQGPPSRGCRTASRAQHDSLGLG